MKITGIKKAAGIMKNTYRVVLVNSQGCFFGDADFTSLATAKKWAQGRGADYYARIYVNGSDVPMIYTPRK